MQISLFPDFTPLSLEHMDIITASNSQYSFQNSDLNMVSLWGYMHQSCSLSRLGSSIVYRLLDYHHGRPYLSIDTNELTLSDADLLSRYIKLHKLEPYLRSIREESVLTNFESISQKYQISNDVDFYDYIYDVSKVAKLIDADFRRKREEVNAFKKRYPDFRFTCDGFAEHTMEQYLDFYYLWEKQNKIKASSMEAEAFQRILSFRELFGLGFPTLTFKGEIVAFGVCEIDDKKHAMMHYSKSSRDYKGSNSIFLNYLCQDLFQRGICYMNYQEDIGIPGLRQQKMSWRPVTMVKKVQIHI